MTRRIGWTPAVFWRSTARELELAIDAAAGRFERGPFISAERVAEIAHAHGRRRSIRKPGPKT